MVQCVSLEYYHKLYIFQKLNLWTVFDNLYLYYSLIAFLFIFSYLILWYNVSSSILFTETMHKFLKWIIKVFFDQLIQDGRKRIVPSTRRWIYVIFLSKTFTFAFFAYKVSPRKQRLGSFTIYRNAHNQHLSNKELFAACSEVVYTSITRISLPLFRLKSNATSN